MNLHQAVRMVRHSNAVAEGTATITPSAGVDRAGFGTVMFLVLWGAITDGTPSIKVQQSDDDGGSDSYGDLEGSSVAVLDTADNKMTWVEVRQSKKWLKCLVVRGGSTGAVVDGIIALLAEPYAQPVSQHSTVSGGEFHEMPAEGTA